MNDNCDFLFWSAKQIATEIRNRKISALEAVDVCLARLQQVNPVINAAVQINRSKARERAGLLDQMAAKGDFVGPLHGVPISIKDSLDTAGIISTGGTMGRKNHVPLEDATVVKRLVNAGAVIVAKTNTPELTLSGETENLIYGRTSNPYALDCSPGGSSGGSVAIIAAGASALELGSDTGGSIREPAHFCGVAGIKPTSGTTSRLGHVIPHCTGILDCLTQIGPIARFVEDLEMGLELIRGPDGIDPHVVFMPWRSPDKIDPKTLRIAFYTNNGLVSVCPDVERVVNQTAMLLEQEGAIVELQVMPGIAKLSEYLNELRQSVTAHFVRRLLKEYGTAVPGPDLQVYLQSSGFAADATVSAALLEAIDQVRSQALGFMQSYDVILCPASRHLARPHGASRGESHEQWSHVTIHNLLGWPGAVVRAGTSIDGNLPVGVQIIAAPWREDIVLAVAKWIETLTGGYHKPEL